MIVLHILKLIQIIKIPNGSGSGNTERGKIQTKNEQIMVVPNKRVAICLDRNFDSPEVAH